MKIHSYMEIDIFAGMQDWLYFRWMPYLYLVMQESRH